MSISDIEREIRDFINEPRNLYALMQDRSVWAQVTASRMRRFSTPLRSASTSRPPRKPSRKEE